MRELNTSIYKLIVGLGNPGPEYVGTRHNAGFMALNEFLNRNGIRRMKKDRHYAWVATSINRRTLYCLKPLTYMNLSGNAVAACLNKWQIKPEEMIVIHDDLDLVPGRIKVKIAGGTGGHKGIASIIRTLNTNNFTRIRIGIGRPQTGESSVDYVLGSPNSQEEKELFVKGILRAVDALEYTLLKGAIHAMNLYNSFSVVDDECQNSTRNEPKTTNSKEV